MLLSALRHRLRERPPLPPVPPPASAPPRPPFAFSPRRLRLGPQHPLLEVRRRRGEAGRAAAGLPHDCPTASVSPRCRMATCRGTCTCGRPSRAAPRRRRGPGEPRGRRAQPRGAPARPLELLGRGAAGGPPLGTHRDSNLPSESCVQTLLSSGSSGP